MEVQARSRIPKLIPRQYGQLKNGNIQLRAENESLRQENKSLQKKLVVLQREATKLRMARLASQKDTDIVKTALVQQGADNATLRRAKEEADRALLLLQQSLSEEHGKCEETEKMEVMQIQRAEKQKSPSCWASIWKWMRKRGEKKKNDI